MRIRKRVFGMAILAVAGLFAAPAKAQEPNAFPITNVNLRAGPGTQYPVILTVPADAPITILGCLPDYTWCDTVFRNYRGWMSAIYLSGHYEGDYYLLRDYAPDLGYQPVTFNISAYWDSYYRDEPFYADRGRWGGPREAGWVDERVFYNRLSPHGSWTWIQGRYVWVPGNVGRDWRPYTRGRWVYTNRGWTWVSNEPFGWATYHYGRWGFSDRVGWFWVPGNQWAPAWVSWRQSDEYLAWAPLPPAYDRGYGRDGGININISFGSVPDYYWSMVPARDFLSDDLPRYYVHDRGRRRAAFNRTRPIGHTKIVNKTIVNNVVNVNYIERKTKKRVVERRIAATDNAEQAGKIEDDTLEVYEPKADHSADAAAPPEPKDVETVAEASETKGQAAGEAATEDRLAPKDVQEAAKKRKGKGRKAGADANAEAEAGGEGEAALPEGVIADAPPPAKSAEKAAPIPAHEVTAPKAKGPDSQAEEEPDATEPEAEKSDKTGALATARPEEPAKPGSSGPSTDEKPGAKEKPSEAKTPDAKDGGKPSAEKETPPADKKPGTAETGKDTPPPSKPVEPEKPAPKKAEPEKPDAKDKNKPSDAGNPGPKDNAKPDRGKPADKETSPADKSPADIAPKQDATSPSKPDEPDKANPEKPGPNANESAGAKEDPTNAGKPEPKDTGKKDERPQADTPAPKPDANEPEAKGPGPKKDSNPEPKAPQAKKSEPKRPEPNEPEGKKPAVKPEPKAQTKPEPQTPKPTPEPKAEPEKPEAKKPEGKKPEGKTPERKKPVSSKPEAKTSAPKAQAGKPAPKPQVRRPAPQKREAGAAKPGNSPAAKRNARQQTKRKPAEQTAQGPQADGQARERKRSEKN